MDFVACKRQASRNVKLHFAAVVDVKMPINTTERMPALAFEQLALEPESLGHSISCEYLGSVG
jgi:hypothetical protein